MDSSIVVKVKHEETLRRFNACVVDNKLEFNLDGLREKIRHLFNFSPDAVMVLTYLDEDDDEITLGDDEDLCDVVSQDLNPLRIHVTFRTERSGTTSNSESCTPLRSPQVQQGFENLNSSVTDLFNSVPEPLRRRVTKLCHDFLASTGTSSGASFTEVVKCVADMGLPYLRQLSESNVFPDSAVRGGAPGTGNASNVAAAQEADSSKVQKLEPEVLENKNCEKLSSETGGDIFNSNPQAISETQPAAKSQVGPKSEVTATDKSVNFSSAMEGSKKSAAWFPGLEAVKAALDSVDSEGDESLSEFTLNLSSALKKKASILDEDDSVGKVMSSPFVGAPIIPGTIPLDKDAFQQLDVPSKPKFKINVKASGGVALSSPFVSPPTVQNTIPSDNKDSLERHNAPPVPKPRVAGPFLPVPTIPNTIPSNNTNSIQQPNVSHVPKPIVTGPTFPFTSGYQTGCNIISQPTSSSVTRNVSANPTVECPFSGNFLGNSPSVPPPLFAPRDSHTRRNHGYRDGSGLIFHRGICCDGCGVHPITGPRFKSKVKDNYDLCSICFAQMGTEKDYVRIDHPLTHRSSLPVKGLYDFPPRVYHHPHQPVFRGCGVKQIRPKLDSRFIQDVNIMDGTLMAPSTPFTKIWRMRNNGSVLWPQGTQLVWIGGDKMSRMFSIDLEITANGFPVEQELDVAVDFTAPDHPGRYISYWRMSSPTGQKFGQRVWVLIQVDASWKALQNEAAPGFNLNMPPVTDGGLDVETSNVNLECVVEDGLLNGAEDLVEPIVNVPPQKEGELNFPINDSLLVGGGLSSEVPCATFPAVLYPIVDLSDDSSASSCDAVASVPPVTVASIPSSATGASNARPGTTAFVAPPFTDASDVSTITFASAPDSVAAVFAAPPFTDVSAPSPVTIASDPSFTRNAFRQPPATFVEASDENEVDSELEKILLNELNKMGFKHVDLNKEALRENKYDLEKSLNDLCGVSEWDTVTVASIPSSATGASDPRPGTTAFVAPPLTDASDVSTITFASAPDSVAAVFAAPPFTDVSAPSPVTIASGPSFTRIAFRQSPATAIVEASDENEVDSELEKILLNELNKMGFKHVDLNKEVLRENKYDLEKSLNDLCGVSEWDPILEELHEMGFHDDEMNKKLLEKNNGSVTQVVLDLLVDEDQL